MDGTEEAPASAVVPEKQKAEQTPPVKKTAKTGAKKIALAVGMGHVSQHPAPRIDPEQAHLHDPMPEEQTHQRVAQFMDGRADKSRGIADKASAAEELIKQLIEQIDQKTHQIDNTDKIQQMDPKGDQQFTNIHTHLLTESA